jgi:hypothetical protein
MNISFLQNSWLILIFKLFKCTGFFSLTDIPAAHEIDNETNYNQEDRHISASLKFQNIYPLPQCMLSVGVCLIIIHLLIYHKIYKFSRNTIFINNVSLNNTLCFSKKKTPISWQNKKSFDLWMKDMFFFKIWFVLWLENRLIQ